MRVERARLRAKFNIADATHTNNLLRYARGIYTAKLPNASIGSELIFIRFDKRRKRHAADLFFSFDQKLDIARQFARDRLHGIDSGQGKVGLEKPRESPLG